MIKLSNRVLHFAVPYASIWNPMTGFCQWSVNGSDVQSTYRDLLSLISLSICCVAPTYEACSTAKFKMGRTENIRAATMEAKLAG